MRVSSPDAWQDARSVMLEYSLTCKSVNAASACSYMRAGKKAQGRMGIRLSVRNTVGNETAQLQGRHAASACIKSEDDLRVRLKESIWYEVRSPSCEPPVMQAAIAQQTVILCLPSAQDPCL